MSPFFITTLISVIIAVLTLGQISPSISNAIFSKNVVIGIGRESALMQQIVRYKGVEGAYPATVADLIGKGYWNATNNDNGFGGNYAFTIDAAKNLVTISTTIADASRRAQYLSSYRHVFKPVDIGSGVVTTTFVIPAANTISAPTPATGSIPVSATAPSAASNTYWYDTSGAAPVLKVSDGTSWTAAGSASSGVAPPNSANIVGAVAALPSSASTGDVRYVYNATSASLDSYVYYNGQWVFSSPGGSSGGFTSSNGVSSQIGAVADGDSCAWNDGVMASDSSGNLYACSDPMINNGGLPTPTCSTTNRVTFDVSGAKYACN